MSSRPTTAAMVSTIGAKPQLLDPEQETSMTLSYRCSNCGTELMTTNADPLHDEIDRLRAALKDIQAKAVGDPPRHTWYYDRAEEALTAVSQS